MFDITIMFIVQKALAMFSALAASISAFKAKRLIWSEIP